MQEWLTYDEAAARIGASAEAIRCRAKRQRWPRTRGNDGRARVQIPDDLHDRATPGRPGDMTAPVTAPADDRLIAALEAHIQTLQADLALARAELTAEREAAREAAAAYRRLADELLELRKASTSAPPPAPRARARFSVAEKSPAAAEEPSPGYIKREDFDAEGGMEEIRRRIEARLAARGH